MHSQISQLRKKINKLSDKNVAKTMQWFFKTGRGEYGEGDRFIGLKVPTQRRLAREFKEMGFSDLKVLLLSPIHEERLISLLILVDKYSRGNEKQKQQVFSFYIKYRKGINNWDLVDLSAPKILGKHLLESDNSLLFKLVLSKNIWDRRIAMIATYEFIRNNKFEITLKLAEVLIKDKHDLIHKASGWMLREIGKRDLEAEEKFLKLHYKKMPRTMLRYAIEKFPEPKRKKYLEGKI